MPDTQLPPSRLEANLARSRGYAWRIAPNLFSSFRYAGMGVSYAFQTQRNFRIHVVLGAIAVGLAFGLGLSATDRAIVTLTVAAVLVMELLNTALESVVDLTVEQRYHELARIAKDCSAGAVLIAAIAAVLVAATLLLPPLWLRLSLLW
ncbi:diacylglycerol kinase family protein [Synechococcus elongatus]|nr:diacylglycerol kinase family protein [Synechococcus elongatus]WKW05985.1 diacylglycerol kinase family protein [Synechococcus elongatus PCC 7942 = FACHB-805]